MEKKETDNTAKEAEKT
jgi:gamma-glutamyl-gamma-aminobutyrate hydrolase PuuD